MKTDAVFTRPIRAEETSRQIALRTRGHSHGRVTRLVSPGDIGELIKPFVFLDYFDADPATAPKFGFHPHSGIATLTVILAGQAFYKETTGREGVIETGGVEWMRASSGVLAYRRNVRHRAHQGLSALGRDAARAAVAAGLH